MTARKNWNREGFPALVSMSDIAHHYEVSPAAVVKWRRDREGFPGPVARISRGKTPVYLMSEVQTWHALWQEERKQRALERVEKAKKLVADALEEAERF